METRVEAIGPLADFARGVCLAGVFARTAAVWLGETFFLVEGGGATGLAPGLVTGLAAVVRAGAGRLRAFREAGAATGGPG